MPALLDLRHRLVKALIPDELHTNEVNESQQRVVLFCAEDGVDRLWRAGLANDARVTASRLVYVEAVETEARPPTGQLRPKPGMGCPTLEHARDQRRQLSFGACHLLVVSELPGGGPFP
jgi:hypothetical protein